MSPISFPTVDAFIPGPLGKNSNGLYSLRLVEHLLSSQHNSILTKLHEYHYSHFTEEDTEALRSALTCPESRPLK